MRINQTNGKLWVGDDRETYSVCLTKQRWFGVCCSFFHFCMIIGRSHVIDEGFLLIQYGQVLLLPNSPGMFAFGWLAGSAIVKTTTLYHVTQCWHWVRNKRRMS